MEKLWPCVFGGARMYIKMVLPHRFEIGRNNATTLLWTEDWIGSGVAWQHSYYASYAPEQSCQRAVPSDETRCLSSLLYTRADATSSNTI